MTEQRFFAVAIGREPGVYETWDEAKKQVNGFSNAYYKKFKSKEEAEEFIAAGAPPPKRPVVKAPVSIKKAQPAPAPPRPPVRRPPAKPVQTEPKFAKTTWEVEWERKQREIEIEELKRSTRKRRPDALPGPLPEPYVPPDPLAGQTDAEIMRNPELAYVDLYPRPLKKQRGSITFRKRAAEVKLRRKKVLLKQPE